jgi:hypothetical protein
MADTEVQSGVASGLTARPQTEAGESAKPSGHTPGPWSVIPARPYDGDDEALAGSFEAFAGIEGADGSPVCVFGDASGSATMFENEADYSLIAAAPTMLAALQAIAGWEDVSSAEWDRSFPEHNARFKRLNAHFGNETLAFRDLAIEIARQAVRAATGEQA